MAVKDGGRRLVIVESPTKATKIASFLGDGYIVESSRGHVRDLPTGAAEVPAKYKGEKWARTGVDVDNGFEALYVVNPDKRATLRSLKDALAKSDELLLATDGDREGEAIAWHLLQELKPKVPARRMVFHEITPTRHRRGGGQPARPRLRPGRRPGDPPDPRPALRLRGLPGAVEEGHAPAVGRPGAVRGHPAGGRPGARADGLPLRLVLGSGRRAGRRREGRAAAVPGPADPGGERRVAQGRDFDSRGRLVEPGLRGSCCTWTRRRPRTWPHALRTAELRASRRVESKPYTRRPYAPFRTTTHAAGGRPQARLHRPAGDVGGPGPVRGRLHHLHADRLGHPVRHGDHRRAQPGAAAVRRRHTCPTGRGSTPPRSRTPRRRTRPSGRRARPS